MSFQLNPLPYTYNSLEPFIDEKTMRLHHDKHHQTYVDKLNAALGKYPKLYEQTIESLLQNLNSIPTDIRTAVVNHGGGVANHNLFWQLLAINQKPSEKIMQILAQHFGSFEIFKEQFTQVSLNHFGSGWSWLVKDKENKLKIYSLPNQDSPLSNGEEPILTLDLWEHAYYLKYQNRRTDYVQAFWNVVNWSLVEEKLNII